MPLGHLPPGANRKESVGGRRKRNCQLHPLCAAVTVVIYRTQAFISMQAIKLRRYDVGIRASLFLATKTRRGSRDM